MSPKAWKASFSDFHRSYNPKSGTRFSFKSPEKPRHSTLSRENSSSVISSQSFNLENPTSEFRDLDLDAGLSHSEIHSPPAEEETASGTAGKGSEEDSNQVEEEKDMKEEESDNKGESEKAPPSESSSEMDNSCDSESLELQLSAADDGLLHIEEREDSPVKLNNPKQNGLENGEVSGFTDLSIHHKVCHSIRAQLRDGDANLLCVFTIFK